jgi:hypothetical protein
MVLFAILSSSSGRLPFFLPARVAVSARRKFLVSLVTSYRRDILAATVLGRRRKILSRLLLPILAVGLSLAQNDAPTGWTAAQWGMTEEQVSAVFPSAQKETIQTTSILALHGFRIGVIDYMVAFGFEPASKALQLVRFSTETTGSPRAIADIAHTDLLSGLTDKYGKAIEASEQPSDHMVARKWIWLFPKTKITLTWTAAKDRDQDFAYRQLDKTYLYYEERKASDRL